MEAKYEYIPQIDHLYIKTIKGKKQPIMIDFDYGHCFYYDQSGKYLGSRNTGYCPRFRNHVARVIRPRWRKYVKSWQYVGHVHKLPIGDQNE